MIKRSYLIALVALLLGIGSAIAQEARPIMEMVARSIVQKYQHTSCQELAMQRSGPRQHTEMEQRVVQALRNDPQMRVEFISQVAAPIANKLFECGLLP